MNNIINPKISILVPVYNVGAYIKDCLLSVVNQTYRNFEVVLVDDGSKDDSVDIAESILSNSAVEYHIIRQNNMGSCTARNVAIMHSCGDYLLHLDADDKLSETLLEKQIETLRTHNFDRRTICFCKWEGLEDGSVGLSKIITHDFSIPSDLLVDLYLNHECLYPHCYLVPRSLVEDSGMWDVSVVLDQDGDFFSRIIVCSNNVLYTSGTKVYYRFGNMTSQSKQVSYKAVNGFVDTAIKKAKLLLRHSNNPKVKDAVYELVSLKPKLFYPYFHRACDKADEFLKCNINRSIEYPKVSLASWLFYWSVKLGLRKFHLKP